MSNQDLSSLLASASRQAGELLKVSVAFRRLSGVGDNAEALWALEDVAINVIGTENFVILACGNGSAMRPIAGMGPVFDEAQHRKFTLAQLDRSGDQVIPLSFGGAIVGAVVIRAFLEHRRPMDAADEQVLALLAHFAATAIVAWDERRDWIPAAARLAS